MREYRQNLQKEHFADEKQNCKTNPEIAHSSQKSATDFLQESYSANVSKKYYKTKSNLLFRATLPLAFLLAIFVGITTIVLLHRICFVSNAGPFACYVRAYVDEGALDSLTAKLGDTTTTASDYDGVNGYYEWGFYFNGLSSVLVVPEAPSGFKWKIKSKDEVFEDKTINSVVEWDWYGDMNGATNYCFSIELVASTSPPTLSVTGSVECDNSMMLLTIVKNDNNAVVQEIGFVTGQTNVTMSGIALETNTTYKVLVTKPFGSVIEVVGATQTSSTVYTFSTGSNATLALTFTLTGNGRWSNTVVV